MARRGQHSLEEIKNMVLTAAETLVDEGGLPLVRVRNIALKIGYTVGSIYMVFENMNELILHLKGRTLDAITGQMDLIEAETAEQRLKGLADVYIRYANQNLNRWSMVFGHYSPETTPVPEWYQHKIDKVFGEFENQFAQFAPALSQAQCKQTALAFIGGLHGICVFMLTSPLSRLNDKDMEESVNLLISKFTDNG